MKYHRYAEAFRLLTGADFQELVADIAEHGLREEIWLYEGQILDGRNRYLACKAAHVEPRYRTYTGPDALSFVISLNKHRRHDNPQELAFAAARIATMRQGQRNDLSTETKTCVNLPPRGGKSQAEAANQLGASVRSTQRAATIIKRGSKALQEAAETGRVSLQKAAAVTHLPKKEQLAAAIEPEGPEENEDAVLALAAKERDQSLERIFEADDKLAAAFAEIKRQASEIAALKIARDGFMNGKAAVERLLSAEQRKTARLEKRIAELETQAA